MASSFFNLPSELRNLIYEFVLTDAKGTCCAYDNNAGEVRYRLYSHDCTFTEFGRVESQHQELNQLKYVCRQLHYETAGLGLWNHIRFPFLTDVNNVDSRGNIVNVLDLDVQEGAVACLGFLKTCSKARRASIRDITIMDPARLLLGIYQPLFNLDATRKLARLCRHHPHMKITLVLFSLSDRADRWVWLRTASVMEVALRKAFPDIRLEHGPVYAKSIVDQMARKFPEYGIEAPPFPTNLIVRPLGWWQQTTRESPLLNDHDQKMVQKWYDEGI